MKEYKYKVITKGKVRTFLWTGLLLGAAMYVLLGSYADYSGDTLAKGLETAGIVLMASTLSFFAGLHYKVDPKSK